jgi:hypothetical protein
MGAHVNSFDGARERTSCTLFNTLCGEPVAFFRIPFMMLSEKTVFFPSLYSLPFP